MSTTLHRRAATAAAALALSLATGALAQTSGAGTSPGQGTATTGQAAKGQGTKAQGGTASAADQQFVQHAAMGGMVEVQLGQAAQQKAADPAVKQFGSRMVTDHGKSNDELKQIAAAKGLQLPATPDDKHMKDMQKLQSLQGAAFDREYMSHMVADHKATVARFEKQAKSGADEQLKGFAAKTLPTLREHLKLAQNVQRNVGAGGAAKKNAPS